MQGILDCPARPGFGMQFASRYGRDYMMRSEKRGGYNTGSSSPNKKRPKRKRRQRAGFFYVFFALLFSIVFWPIGMIMLWRRKVRWRITTKLLFSIITLFLCVTLIGFGLTVDTGHPTVTKVQDAVNDFLDNSAVYMADAYTVICEKSVEVYERSLDVGVSASQAAAVTLADLLDIGTEKASEVKVVVVDWVGTVIDSVSGSEDTVAVPTDAPAASGMPEVDDAPVVTDTPAETDVPAATDAPTAEPAATDEPASTDKPTAAPTDVPAATAVPENDGEEQSLSLALPEFTPDPASASPIGNGQLDQDGTFTEATSEPTVDPTAEPTAEPETPAETATAEPTATPVAEPTASPVPVIDPSLMPKPAAEAVVYYNPSGVGYHMESTCVGMRSAPPHTLAEAIEDGKRACSNCNPPEASALEADNLVWVDENNFFHLSDDCGEFEGLWSLMPLDEAVNAGISPCGTCKAGLYMAAWGLTLPTPSPEPTPVPTPAPTPEPETVSPARPLKSAGEILVYHTRNGGWYHTIPNCSNMTGATQYTLADSLENGFERCRKCDAPQPELLEEHCMWVDENALCHTSDECIAFEGSCTLIPRDEALAEGYTGCRVCYADEYLVENTVIAYPAE